MLVRGFGGGGGFTGRSAPLMVTAGGGSGPGGACANNIPAANKFIPQNPVAFKMRRIIISSRLFIAKIPLPVIPRRDAKSSVEDSSKARPSRQQFIESPYRFQKCNCPQIPELLCPLPVIRRVLRQYRHESHPSGLRCQRIIYIVAHI